MATLMMYGIADKAYGEIELVVDDGEASTMHAVILTLEVVDTETLEKGEQVLVVPQEAGPALLAALLTEEQFDTLAGGGC